MGFTNCLRLALAVPLLAATPILLRAADPQPSTRTISPEEAKAPGQPALYTYSVGVEEPVARELEKLATPLPGDKQAYRLYLADAERVRELLRTEFAAGNVVGMRTLNRPLVRPVAVNQELLIDGAHLSAYRGERDNKWDLSTDGHFPKCRIVGTAGGLRLTARLETFHATASDYRWKSATRELRDLGPTIIDTELSPGQALVGVLDLGTVGNARRSAVLVIQCLRLTPEQATILGKANEAEQWLRLGPAGVRMVVDYAAAYRAAATQPSAPRDEAAWTQTLSDGTKVRLASIGLPVHYPFLMWDPDGNPVPEQGDWHTVRAEGGLAGHTIPDATSIYCSITSPHPIGERFTEAKRPDGTTEYQRLGSGGTWTSQRVSDFNVRMGVGPWQSAGKVKDGAKLRAGDATIRISEVKSNHGELRILYRQEGPADLCFTFVAVTKPGKQIWPGLCDAALRQGPGNLAFPINFDLTAMLWTGEEKLDHIELLWRKAETVHFAGYAMEPNERPPFDLARDFTLTSSAQPTRLATSRPAVDPKDLPAASMQQLLTSARAGDLAAVESYLTGGTPEHRSAAAKMIVYPLTAHESFRKRYGTAPAGRLGSIPNELQRALLDKEIILTAPDSASTKRLAFRRTPDGKWLIDVTTLVPEEVATQRVHQAESLHQLQEHLEAGQYPTAAEAQKALDAALK